MDAQREYTSFCSHTDTVIYLNVHTLHFREPHSNKNHNVLVFQFFSFRLYFFVFFNLLLLLYYSLFSFNQPPSNLLCSFFISLHLSLHVSAPSLCLFLLIFLSSSSLHHYLSASLSLWGHWGQAWCRGLVDKYHVRLFHVFSGRDTVYLSSTVPQRSLAVHKVYLHF